MTNAGSAHLIGGKLSVQKEVLPVWATIALVVAAQLLADAST